MSMVLCNLLQYLIYVTLDLGIPCDMHDGNIRDDAIEKV